jgi:hypothetical protein
VEVEYRLHSWGELFSPFVGDREHSIAARFILTEFPFKLFSSSTPYDDPLPQKLCLTFRAPREERWHSNNSCVSGFFSHEIAKELAAFLSLVTRRRIFVDKQIRYEGLPVEDEAELYSRSHVQERQRLKEIQPKEIYRLLDNLQNMDRSIANGFILAMRLYHSAIGIMYTEPEFSYLLLVTCLEAVSSAVFKDFQIDDEERFLDSRFPGWDKICNALPVKCKQKLKDLLLKNEPHTFGRLLKFITENVPAHFFSDEKDDAKPDYHVALVGSRDSLKEFAQEYGIDYMVEADLNDRMIAQKYVVRSPQTITEIERVKRARLKQALQDIYNARSRLIHEGRRLPKSIVFGLFRGLPTEALAEMQEREESKSHMKIPPLLTFERLVSCSMLEFLSKQK